MTDTVPNNITDEDLDAIVAGLHELRRNGSPRLAALYGPRSSQGRIRQQLYLTPVEHHALKTLTVIVSMAVGRPVNMSLVIRLALSHLLVLCRRSLADPAVAERIKADVLAVRKERAAERE